VEKDRTEIRGGGHLAFAIPTKSPPNPGFFFPAGGWAVPHFTISLSDNPMYGRASARDLQLHDESTSNLDLLIPNSCWIFKVHYISSLILDKS
jgi:hypothetical protein